MKNIYPKWLLKNANYNTKEILFSLRLVIMETTMTMSSAVQGWGHTACHKAHRK